MTQDYNGRHVWIIGASSGIGRALAQELARRGAVLLLSARREDELKALHDELGGGHHVLPLDVSDDKAVFAAAEKIKTLVPRLDSAVFMAATYVPTSFEETKIDDLRRAVDINLYGAFAVTLAACDLYKAQKGGQIALCASVAGYRGLPNAQPYSATKAALMNLAETLYIDLAAHNIDVKVINPGFVRTPMTDKNDFAMPMIIEPAQAAKAIADGLQKRAFEIHFPKRFTLIMKLVHMLPPILYFPLVKKMKVEPEE